MEGLYRELKDEGFVVLAVEWWTPRSRLKVFEQQYGVTYPMLTGGPPHGYPVRGSPSLALLDRTGRAVAYRPGGECDLREVKPLIRALLAHPRQ